MTNITTNNSGADHRDTESILSAYIGQTLTPEERKAFEKEIAADPFLADALEGLNLGDPGTVARSVKQLKKHLRRSVSKKERLKHRSLAPHQSFYWAIAVVLLLAVAAVVVLRLLGHR